MSETEIKNLEKLLILIIIVKNILDKFNIMPINIIIKTKIIILILV